MDLKKAQVENRAITSAIDTNSHNIASMSSSDSYVKDLWERTRNLKIDDSIDIEYPNITLHLTKQDDGAYKGYVTKAELDVGDEIPLRFESKSIPEIVSMLEVKEYVPPDAVRQDKEPVPVAPVPAGPGIVLDRGTTVVINIQKSIDQIKDLVKSASVEGSFGKRESIAKDLCDSLAKSGYTPESSLEIIKKSGSLYDVLEYLPPRVKAGFLNRLNTHNEVCGEIQDIAGRIDLPAEISSDNDIIKAKRGFSYIVKALSDSRPIHKASASTFAFFKSKYGAEAMSRIKNNIRKKPKSFGVTLGDLMKSNAPQLIPMKESVFQPDEGNTSFVPDPFKK